jgi:CRP-like cAMP-binding protein
MWCMSTDFSKGIRNQKVVNMHIFSGQTKKMFDKILQSIRKLGSFSEHELSIFTEMLKEKNVPKDSFLLKEGKVCQSFYFINQGSLRQFFITEDNSELTLNLFTENDWAFDYQSFTSQKPSANCIQAFEDTDIFELDIHAFHELILKSQSFFKIGKLLEAGLLNDHLYNSTTSPEGKYLDLLQKKPLWIQKFPLKYIASYLRITPETLSRVRRKINQ